MKLKRLQKVLIKKGSIFLGVITVIGGAGYVVYDVNVSLTDKINGLKSNVAMADSEARVLSKKLEDANDAIAYYENFNTTGQGDPQNFRRDAAKSLLANLREKDAIFDLKLSMEPFAKAVGEGFEKPNAALYVSKVTVQFATGADIDAYNLIRNIAESFPGNVDIKSYNITRASGVEDSKLLAISGGQMPEGMVKGEVVFEWQGIQDNPDYKKAPPVPVRPGAPGGPNG